MNTIQVIGLNHRTAGVEIRERYALTNVESVEEKLLGGPLREVMALSTCNRVEIVAVGQAEDVSEPSMGQSDSAVTSHVLDTWAACCGQPAARLADHVYVHRGDAAVEHLFRVAGGLDSMVLGEPQILGQLKEAYRRAVEARSARVIINRLLHKAFFVAKRVRSETAVASSAVSISYAAVELAKRIFGELGGRRAMLVGAGEMAELAALHLVNSGVESILVANRTFERGQELAQRFNGQAVAFEELYARLPQVDIIISSTGSPETVIHAKDVKPVLRNRKRGPMFFIDIAVPRDVDPDINQLDNAYVYDIDDLKDVVEENLDKRRDEAIKAQDIVRAEVDGFRHWLSSLALQPTIVDLLSKGEATAQRELNRTLKRLGPDVDEKTRQALEVLVYSLAAKLYREPIVFLKRRSEEEGNAERFIDLVRRMFNLDNERVPGDAHQDRKPCRGAEKQ